MDPEFWHERWTKNEIGFHRSTAHWALAAHWHSLNLASGIPVLVPLCGKSLDLHWLVQAGHRVTGIELSETAIEAFFAAWMGVDPSISVTKFARADGLVAYQARSVTLIQGNFFQFEPDEPFHAFYDRAALIAMPPSMRAPYLAHLWRCLAPGARGLVVTYDYAQKQMVGPPFSVGSEELTEYLGDPVTPLECRDVLKDHRGMQSHGVTGLVECVYRITRA